MVGGFVKAGQYKAGLYKLGLCGLVLIASTTTVVAQSTLIENVVLAPEPEAAELPPVEATTKQSVVQETPGDQNVDEESKHVVPAMIGTHDAPNFFVVNSIPCPQKSDGRQPRCQGVVHRFLPDGRFHPSDKETMLASLRPGVPVCIAFHGFLVRAKDLYPQSIARYKRTMQASNDRPLHFISTHWPSDPGTLVFPAIALDRMGRAAEFNGFYVANLMNRIPPENPICLIGHSLGCRVIASALHLLGGGEVQGHRVHNKHPERRIRVVFGAAAIDHHWLNPGERFGCAINRMESMLNIRNSTDIALKLYPLREPLLHHALGRDGFHDSDLEAIGWQTAKIAQWDVSHLVGMNHMIAGYARHPQIRAFYSRYVYFD